LRFRLSYWYGYINLYDIYFYDLFLNRRGGLPVLFEAGKLPLDGVADLGECFFACFSLRAAAGDRRTLRNRISVFFLLDQHSKAPRRVRNDLPRISRGQLNPPPRSRNSKRCNTFRRCGNPVHGVCESLRLFDSISLAADALFVQNPASFSQGVRREDGAIAILEAHRLSSGVGGFT